MAAVISLLACCALAQSSIVVHVTSAVSTCEELKFQIESFGSVYLPTSTMVMKTGAVFDCEKAVRKTLVCK